MLRDSQLIDRKTGGSSAEESALPHPAMALPPRITVEIWKTHFKYPCVRLEREEATPGGPSAAAAPPVAMIANQFIIRINTPGAPSASRLADILGTLHVNGSTVKNLAIPDSYLVDMPQIPCSAGPMVIGHFAWILNKLRKMSDVEYAEPNFLYFADGEPDDLLRSKQWGLHDVPNPETDIRPDVFAYEAWDRVHDNHDVLVAVVDSGVDYTHKDLEHNIWTGEEGAHGRDLYSENNEPLDSDGHGTHVAGIIGAEGNNHFGVSGVVWHVRMIPVRFMDKWVGALDAAGDAIEYALSMNAKIISCSWGSTGSDSKHLRQAIRDAEAQKAIVVCSAGNDKLDNDRFPHFPSSYDSENIIAVAATNRSAELWEGSNYGHVSVDLGAPGSRIYSTVRGQSYDYLNGTSVAVPFVSGACALVWAKKPSATPAEVKKAILDSVDSLQKLQEKCFTGGRLNVDKALSATAGG